uniref:Uncharacterized protein n=1 Tax=Hordeum vulgare subsp. vulgare TaxID=112509 RepID=A0A8I6WK60_HORVV
MDGQRCLLGEVLLSGNLPRIFDMPFLAAHLEGMGPAEGQVLSLACEPRPMLDRGQTRSPRPPPSHSLPALRPRAGDHPTPATHLPLRAASLARGPFLAAPTTPPSSLRKALRSATLLVPWMIWKHRNACVFDHITPSLAKLSDRIKDEMRCWARAGDKGLRVVLPPSWDVH